MRRDGQPVAIASRPAQALLAYLVLHPGACHRRKRLAGLLWPESDEASARGNLRLALWRINKTLGNACLRADRVLIAFDAHEACWIDVATLERTSAHASTDELLDSLRAFCLALLPAAGSCAPSEAITP